MTPRLNSEAQIIDSFRQRLPIIHACKQLEILHNRAAAELRDLITKADATDRPELGHQATLALCELGSMWLHIKTLRTLIKDPTP